jgi:hypothetical protein
MNKILCLVLLAVVGLVGTACGSACGCASTPSPVPTSTLPPDVFELGDVRLATSEEASNAISRDAAVNAAVRDGYGTYGDPDAYLVVMTYDATRYAENAIVNRLIWLLRWDYLQIPAPAPIGQDGSIVPGDPYTRAFIGVDAIAGTIRFSELRD